MKKTAPQNNDEGFALLDAMVALAIFAIMSALLFQTVSSTVLAKRHVADSRRAILIAQSRLAELQESIARARCRQTAGITILLGGQMLIAWAIRRWTIAVD
jgi:type II secretory pathway component PulJ